MAIEPNNAPPGGDETLHRQALQFGSRLYEQYRAAQKTTPDAVMIPLQTDGIPAEVVDHTVAHMSEYGWYLQRPDGATLLARRLTPQERDAYTASKLAAALVVEYNGMENKQEFIDVNTKPSEGVIAELGRALLALGFVPTHLRRDQFQRFTGVMIRPNFGRPRLVS